MIVNCARRLFVEKGYGATTTDDIAAQCKISKQTLYRLFPGKSALFAAVVAAHRQIWLDLPHGDDEMPLADALAQIFMVDIDEAADRERIEVLQLVVVEGRIFPELTEILKSSGLEISQAALADWLRLQQARGRLRGGDTMAMTKMLLDMVFGAIIVRNIGKLEWPGGKARRDHIRTCIEVFLHGTCAERNAG